MHHNYKQEQAIRKIIDKNVKPADENAKIDLIIYYKNSKTRHLIMKNNPRPHQDDLKAHHVVYHFKCPVGRICPHNCVGKTTTTRFLNVYLAMPKKVLFFFIFLNVMEGDRLEKSSQIILKSCIELLMIGDYPLWKPFLSGNINPPLIPPMKFSFYPAI